MRGKIEIAPIDAGSHHLRTVAGNMRWWDRMEMNAAGLTQAHRQLTRTVEMGHESYAGLVDGVAVCAFGLTAGVLLAGVARPWLIGTEELPAYRVPFLRRNRPMVARWRSRFPCLENWVWAGHKPAIAWLERLGFTLDPAAPFGPFGQPFRRFHCGRPELRDSANVTAAIADVTILRRRAIVTALDLSLEGIA